MYQQPDELCAVPDPCRSLEAALSQLQASTSAEDHLGRWGLMDFSSPTTEEAFSSQYYQHTAPQPFCSPTTPGPSPQYPQTPTLSSPPMQSWEETRNLYPQTSAQSSSPSLQEYEGYTSQHQVPPTNHLLMSQYELIQDQSGLFDAGLCPQVMAQEVGGSSPSPRLPAGLSWREDGGMAAGHGPSDVAWAAEGTGTAVSKKYYSPDAVKASMFLFFFCKSHFCPRKSVSKLKGVPRIPSAGNSPQLWTFRGETPTVCWFIYNTRLLWVPGWSV